MPLQIAEGKGIIDNDTLIDNSEFNVAHIAIGIPIVSYQGVVSWDSISPRFYHQGPRHSN